MAGMVLTAAALACAPAVLRIRTPESLRAEVSQHLFSIDERPASTSAEKDQSAVKGGAVSRIEPVARIEREESHFSALGELRRFIHDEPTIVNAGFESHAERIL